MKKANTFCNLIHEELKGFLSIRDVEAEMENGGLTDEFIDILERIYENEEQFILKNLQQVKSEYLQKKLVFDQKDHYRGNMEILRENLEIILDLWVDEVWKEPENSAKVSDVKEGSLFVKRRDVLGLKKPFVKNINQKVKKRSKKKKTKKHRCLDHKSEEVKVQTPNEKNLKGLRELSVEHSPTSSLRRNLYSKKKEGPSNLKDLKMMYRKNVDTKKVSFLVKDIKKPNTKTLEDLTLIPSYPKRQKSNSKNSKFEVEGISIIKKKKRSRKNRKKLTIPTSSSMDFPFIRDAVLKDIKKRSEVFNYKRRSSKSNSKKKAREEETLSSILKNKRIVPTPKIEEKDILERKIGDYVVKPNPNKQFQRKSILEKIIGEDCFGKYNIFKDSTSSFNDPESIENAIKNRNLYKQI